MNRQGSDSAPQSSRVPTFYGLQGTDRLSQEVDHFSVASPLTPESEPAFAFPQSSDGSSYYYHLPDFSDHKPERLPSQGELAYAGELQAKQDTCMKEILCYPYTSPTQPVAR